MVKKEVEFKAFPNGINSIGAIIVPESEPQTFVVVEQKDYYMNQEVLQ